MDSPLPFDYQTVCGFNIFNPKISLVAEFSQVHQVRCGVGQQWQFCLEQIAILELLGWLCKLLMHIIQLVIGIWGALIDN